MILMASTPSNQNKIPFNLHILKAANAIIGNNQSRLGKSLWTEGEAGEPIELYAAFNEQDEARFIVGTIEQQLKQHCFEKKTRRSLRVLIIYGGQRFYERFEIKHATAHLRLVSNRQDAFGTCWSYLESQLTEFMAGNVFMSGFEKKHASE